MLKRIILLCTGVLLSVLVLGSIAWASHAPSHQDVTVDIQQATRGLQGSVVVSGTIVCEGDYAIDIIVRQKSARGRYNTGYRLASGQCSSGEPTPWERTVFGERPFRRGSIAVETDALAEYFDPNTGEYRSGSDTEVKEFRLRKR